MRSRITLACASNMSDTYFRNTSPSTGCLYSAADTEPRSLLAVSHSVFLNSSLVMEPLVRVVTVPIRLTLSFRGRRQLHRRRNPESVSSEPQTDSGFCPQTARAAPE